MTRTWRLLSFLPQMAAVLRKLWKRTIYLSIPFFLIFSFSEVYLLYKKLYIFNIYILKSLDMCIHPLCHQDSKSYTIKVINMSITSESLKKKKKKENKAFQIRLQPCIKSRGLFVSSIFSPCTELCWKDYTIAPAW